MQKVPKEDKKVRISKDVLEKLQRFRIKNKSNRRKYSSNRQFIDLVVIEFLEAQK